MDVCLGWLPEQMDLLANCAVIISHSFQTTFRPPHRSIRYSTSNMKRKSTSAARSQPSRSAKKLHVTFAPVYESSTVTVPGNQDVHGAAASNPTTLVETQHAPEVEPLSELKDQAASKLVRGESTVGMLRTSVCTPTDRMRVVQAHLVPYLPIPGVEDKPEGPPIIVEFTTKAMFDTCRDKGYGHLRVAAEELLCDAKGTYECYVFKHQFAVYGAFREVQVTGALNPRPHLVVSSKGIERWQFPTHACPGAWVKPLPFECKDVGTPVWNMCAVVLCTIQRGSQVPPASIYTPSL